MSEIPVEQIYFIETAWNELRAAYACKQSGRVAKAQEHMMEARFYEAKIHPQFTDRELRENMDKLSTQLYRGY